MGAKRYSIWLAGLVVFALCAAATTSSTDLTFLAKSHGPRISGSVHRASHDRPVWTAAKKLRTPSPLAFLDAAISPASAVMPVPVRDRFHDSSFPSLYAAGPLTVPSDRAPPSR